MSEATIERIVQTIISSGNYELIDNKLYYIHPTDYAINNRTLVMESWHNLDTIYAILKKRDEMKHENSNS